MAELCVRRKRLSLFRLDGVRETGRDIGSGAYGTVVELKYRGLKCAGKKLHEKLFDEGMLQRFEDECEILSGVRHPHVVQFLGVTFEPSSRIPTLVMEFMHSTLSSCLQDYGVLPEEISYSVLDDVATALCYLHGQSPPLLHRDLTANNVLLTPDMRAKISDLGMAKIANRGIIVGRDTRIPGNPDYMPPEAFELNPNYNAKLDCFSYGVLLLHVFSGRWPTPSGANSVDPNNQQRLIPRDEVQRREEYFKNLAKDHPLLHLTHKCLCNCPDNRPDAENILYQVKVAASQIISVSGNKVAMLHRQDTNSKEKQDLIEKLSDMTSQLHTLREEYNAHLASVNQKYEETLRQEMSKTDLERQRSESRISEERLRMQTKMSEEEQRLEAQIQAERKRSKVQAEYLQACKHSLLMEIDDLMCAHSISEQCSYSVNTALGADNAAVKLKLQNMQERLAFLENDIQTQRKHFESNAELAQKEIGGLREELELMKSAVKNKDEEIDLFYKQMEAVTQEVANAKTLSLIANEEAHLKCQELEALKMQYEAKKTEMVLLVQSHELRADSLTTVEKALSLKEVQLQTTTVQSQQAISALQDENRTLVHDLEIRKGEINDMESVEVSLKETIGTLNQQLELAQSYISRKDKVLLPLSFNFQSCADLPVASECLQCVVINGSVYTGGGLTDSKEDAFKIFKFDSFASHWVPLPDCPVQRFGLACYNGRVITIGGIMKTSVITESVYCFSDTSQLWELDPDVPPLRSKRFHPMIVSYGSSIAACGGVMHGGNLTDLVEVFRSGDTEWKKGPPLANRCCLAKTVISDDSCRLLGGLFSLNPEAPSCAIMSTLLSNLFAANAPQGKWKIERKEATHYKATPANIAGALVTIGGWNQPELAATDEILALAPSLDLWMKVDRLPCACYNSITAQLPNKQLMIIGGIDKDHKKSKVVLLASLKM